MLTDKVTKKSLFGRLPDELAKAYRVPRFRVAQEMRMTWSAVAQASKPFKASDRVLLSMADVLRRHGLTIGEDDAALVAKLKEWSEMAAHDASGEFVEFVEAIHRAGRAALESAAKEAS